MATVAMLTACSENEAANNNQDALQTKENPVVQQENEQSKDYIQEDAKENVNQSQWTSLPEYNEIIEQIGDKDVTFEMETDNEGKRVLNILEQDGSILYKSIFIKNTNRLKIINVKRGKKIFNGTLS